MRLIDADACYPYFYDHLDDRAIPGAMNAIEEMPTINLVRCRDCTLWKQHQLFKEIGYCTSVFKGKETVCTPGSFFCADGRPKIDAEVEGWLGE